MRKFFYYLRLSLILIIPLLLAGAQLFLDHRPAWGEFYARHIFPIVAAPLIFLSSSMPFSLGFVTLFILLPVAILFFIIMMIAALFKRKDRAKRLRRYAYRGLLVLSVLYSAFMLLHGLNYTRQPLKVNLNLDSKPSSAEELMTTTLWLAEEANQAREGLLTDEAGRLALPMTRAELMRLAQENPPDLLQGIHVRPKLVPFSHYWSYTNICGIYFPFLAEANVNADIMPDELLFTALHEIAHVRGFAREDEANFLAFYSGLRHGNPYFRYAAYESAFLYCYNSLAGIDPEKAAECWAALGDGVAVDIAARSAYWKQFAGPIEKLATQANEQFLQANRQVEGIKSYGRVVDLLIAYEQSRGR